MLNKLIAQYGQFRVVLDDGSHINSLTLISMQTLLKFTTEFYIIEDLRNSYEDLTRDVQFWPGMHLNKNLDANNAATRPQLDKYLLEMIKFMDYRMGNLTGVHFHAQMVLLQKGRVG
jgi:hypothetical protein